MTSALPKPPMAAELRTALAAVEFPTISNLTPETISMMRTAVATPPAYLEGLNERGISHREVRIPSTDGSRHEIVLSILEPAAPASKLRPCLYWMHGGALHWGDRLHTLEIPEDIILACDAICISIEYRLAPEHAFPIAVEDCYAGLLWTSSHATELGIDSTRIMVGGISAGGLLAATIVLLCRDRKGPALHAQLLVCPASDDRLVTVSSHQYLDAADFIPRVTLEHMWKSSLGSTGSEIVPPARTADVSGLPTTYLDVGSAESLRDETVAYASRLWAAGVQAELHVWAGGFHGFDIFVPEAKVAQAARAAKVDWVKRVL